MWAASLDLIAFKEEVRGSNPLRATDACVRRSLKPPAPLAIGEAVEV